MTSGFVTVRFTSKGHIGSKIAALPARAGGFNHTMLLDQGMVYEAVTLAGVRFVTPRAAMRRIRRYQDMRVFVPDLEAMRAFLREQLGALYDVLGAMGMPFLRSGNWEDPERWWCAELVIAALLAGGVKIIDAARARWGTLRDLYTFDAPKSKVVRTIAGCGHL
jgi:hypothetical protein